MPSALDDPLKRWKLSPIDSGGADEIWRLHQGARGDARRRRTPNWAPWTLVDFNDQRRGRLTLIRDLLDRLPDTKVQDAPIDWKPLGA